MQFGISYHRGSDVNMEDRKSDNVKKTLLRERVLKIMGAGVRAQWTSLPEVQNGRLADSLPEDHLELEELKFCLITSEVAFNIELVELVSLCKKSITWADPLPVFNRRTIASTIEKVKRCSDVLLNSIEKHWNANPILSMAKFCELLTEMEPHFQSFITYCTHLEDFRCVLRTAVRSKPEIRVASFSERLNVERALLPVQHLKLIRYLLQDIRAELTPPTKRLESFHCRRALTEVTKLLEDCYKTLATLHGEKYVEKLDLLLEESVHGCDRNYSKKCLKEIPTRSCSNSSSKHVALRKSYQSTKTSESENSQVNGAVNGHCKYSNLFANDANNNNCKPNNRTIKFNEDPKSKKLILRRGKPVQLSRRKNDALKYKSSPVFGENEVWEIINNNKYKENYFPAKSNSFQTISGKDRTFSVCCFPPNTNMHNDKNIKNSERHFHELRNNFKNSSCEDDTVISEVTTQIDAITNNCDFETKAFSEGNDSVSDIISEITQSNSKSTCQIEDSDVTHTSLECISACDKGINSVISNNSSGFCDANKADIGISPSFNATLTNKDKFSSMELFPACTGSVEVVTRIRAHSEPTQLQLKTKEKSVFPIKFDENDELSQYEEIDSLIESLSDDGKLTAVRSPTDSSKLQPRQTFVSSYDIGCVVMGKDMCTLAQDIADLYESYKPMNENFKRNHNSISPSKFKRKINIANESDIKRSSFDLRKLQMFNRRESEFEHAYEEVEPRESLLTSYRGVPLYQAYKYRNVKVASRKSEDNIYIEPEEHVYEEIGDYLKTEINHKVEEKEKVLAPTMEISKPSGTSQRVRWADIPEVTESGLLDNLDSGEIALQEAKYEIITSEASYFKSLAIVDAIFVSNPDLAFTLSKEDYDNLFSDVKKVKQCSERFLVALLDGWQDDLMLDYLCKAVSKFVESGEFQVYVNTCGNQLKIGKTLECLRLVNSKFTKVLSELEADSVCQNFTLQSFLTLPMQRVTRLPLLIQAILRRRPVESSEYQSWKNILIQLQEVANDCNEAIGKVDRVTMEQYNQLKLLNRKILTLNSKDVPSEKKKQQTIWNFLTLRR